MKYVCKTSFDITNTGVTGHYKSSRVPFTDLSGQEITDEYTWNHARNQQRNWETLTQIISLRAQLSKVSTPIKKGSIWIFNFEVETPDAYGQANDPVAILRLDSDGVPMLVKLNEEHNLESYFVVAGPQQNIWFWVEE